MTLGAPCSLVQFINSMPVNGWASTSDDGFRKHQFFHCLSESMCHLYWCIISSRSRTGSERFQQFSSPFAPFPGAYQARAVNSRLWNDWMFQLRANVYNITSSTHLHQMKSTNKLCYHTIYNMTILRVPPQQKNPNWWTRAICMVLIIPWNQNWMPNINQQSLQTQQNNRVKIQCQILKQQSLQTQQNNNVKIQCQTLKQQSLQTQQNNNVKIQCQTLNQQSLQTQQNNRAKIQCQTLNQQSLQNSTKQ